MIGVNQLFLASSKVHGKKKNTEQQIIEFNLYGVSSKDGGHFATRMYGEVVIEDGKLHIAEIVIIEPDGCYGCYRKFEVYDNGELVAQILRDPSGKRTVTKDEAARELLADYLKGALQLDLRKCDRKALKFTLQKIQ